jgi:hypothetical protein
LHGGLLSQTYVLLILPFVSKVGFWMQIFGKNWNQSAGNIAICNSLLSLSLTCKRKLHYCGGFKYGSTFFRFGTWVLNNFIFFKIRFGSKKNNEVSATYIGSFFDI